MDEIMLWEELTEPQFKKAIEDTGGVCILPIGAIERHGPHLPLGTDMFIARHLAKLAVEIEPAVVFPYFPFGLIPEASHYPGTVVTDGDYLMQLLDATCKEIARNGFKKIMILNAHGGNPSLLRAFAMSQMRSSRDYAVYIYDSLSSSANDPEYTKKYDELFKGYKLDGHAGNVETSMLMHIRSDLVDFEKSVNENAEPLNRLPFLDENNLYNSMFWYADFPYHYAGSPANSSAEAGEWLFNYTAKKAAAAIKAIREDTEVAKLMAEFYGNMEH